MRFRPLPIIIYVNRRYIRLSIRPTITRFCEHEGIGLMGLQDAKRMFREKHAHFEDSGISRYGKRIEEQDSLCMGRLI